MKSFPILIAFVAITTFGCASSDKDTKGAQGVEPTPDEMMAAMMRAGTPGEHHAKLDAFLGRWDAHLTMWMDPKLPPSEMMGTITNAWMYDGRYLQQKFTGEFEGQPFSGLGMWGYDVAAGKYIATWVDSMSTTMMISTGPASADGKTFTLEGTSTNPVTGKPATCEEIITVNGPDRHTLQFFEMRGGERVKTGEIVYTRKP